MSVINDYVGSFVKPYCNDGKFAGVSFYLPLLFKSVLFVYFCFNMPLVCIFRFLCYCGVELANYDLCEIISVLHGKVSLSVVECGFWIVISNYQKQCWTKHIPLWNS